MSLILFYPIEFMDPYFVETCRSYCDCSPHWMYVSFLIVFAVGLACVFISMYMEVRYQLLLPPPTPLEKMRQELAQYEYRIKRETPSEEYMKKLTEISTYLKKSIELEEKKIK